MALLSRQTRGPRGRKMNARLPAFRPAQFFSFILLGFLSVASLADEPPVDMARERARAASALTVAVPNILSVESNGSSIWVKGQTAPAHLSPGQWITVHGSGFGAGPDVDYAKVLVGTTRVLERDVRSFLGTVNFIQRLFYEFPEQFDQWEGDFRNWSDTAIEFRVPVTASHGPLVVQVQKRIGALPSLNDASRPHAVWDPMTERISDANFIHQSDVISTLGLPVASEEIPVAVENPEFQTLAEEGEAAFWVFDYNVGLTHHLNKMDWPTVLAGRGSDPQTGRLIDATTAFGAIPVNAEEVPAVASRAHDFEPYPSPMPIKPLLRQPLSGGWAQPTGYVGYSYVQSIHPFTQIKGSWVGFSCVSCHSQRVTYEAAPGKTVTKVFPGIPNVQWSMKWNVLGGMKGIVGKETGPDGTVAMVDKTQLIWAVPNGTGEASLVRGADDGSRYANDYLFSPIAIPIITRHTPVRRALSRSEMIIGFEGSYAHAEEPDGGVGALNSRSLQALTAYMTTLDEDDGVLRNLGMYRWLKRTGQLGQINSIGEGQFLQSNAANYPQLQSHLARGRATYRRDCLSCHQPNFGTWSDENMFPLTQVGSYFSPTIFQRQVQSIRTSILRDLYWVEGRGLLHDGHVKSLEDLVNPARCTEGSELYRQYYTLHPGGFHIAKGTPAQERALRRHAYFADVSWDKDNLYWDYQAMRRAFGPREFGAQAAVPLPAAPHPWCAKSAEEVSDLVEFLLSL